MPVGFQKSGIAYQATWKTFHGRPRTPSSLQDSRGFLCIKSRTKTSRDMKLSSRLRLVRVKSLSAPFLLLKESNTHLLGFVRTIKV